MKPLSKSLVLMLFGGLVGFGLGWGVAYHLGPQLWRGHHHKQELLQQFSATLHLTPEQYTKVAAILEEKEQKIEALRATMKPRFEDIRTSTSAEIRQLLTPEQQPKFDAVEAEWNARRERFRKQWGRDR